MQELKRRDSLWSQASGLSFQASRLKRRVTRNVTGFYEPSHFSARDEIRRDAGFDGETPRYTLLQRPLDAAEQVRLIRLADFHGIFAVLEIRIGINDVFAVASDV